MAVTRKNIVDNLAIKGLELAYFEYERSIPTPHGHERGWNVSLSEDSQLKISEKQPYFYDWEPEADNLLEISEWAKRLPDCSSR